MPKTTEQGTLAYFSYMPCVHQGDYQVKINMRFGLAEQQHEIKTDKHQRLERVGDKTNEIQGIEPIH